MTTHTPPISDATIAAVAAEAVVHVLSVQRRMLGLRVRGKAGERIDAVLAKRGLRAPVHAT